MSSRPLAHATLRCLPRASVTIDGGFWGPRVTTNQLASLHHGYQMLEENGQLRALRLAAEGARAPLGHPIFRDSDVYKWVEAVCWELGRCTGEAERPPQDARLEDALDSVIELITAAQDPDGYLNTQFQVAEPEQRWKNLRDHHELYCAGHLFQAAVADSRSRGATRLLGVACRFADHLVERFGPGQPPAAPGHPQVETALVELYRVTDEPRYLALARRFIDARGHGILGEPSWVYGGIDYHADQVPLRRATEVRGHAVRQLYLLAGGVDVALETGDAELAASCERLHRDCVSTKSHITGGLGARHSGEAFGTAYELPNERAYCETCAAIADIFFCWRLLLLTGHSKYADAIERVLYNAFLVGGSRLGTKYFYSNPLASSGGHERAEWHGCACCPPNVMRLLASLDHYVATRTDRGLQLQQYVSGSVEASGHASAEGHGFHVALRVSTRYPWAGSVSMTVREAEGQPELRLRIPGFCQRPTLRVNGRAVETAEGSPGEADRPRLESEVRDGYLLLRGLERGDELELELPMPVRRRVAHPRVEACQGCVAVERGPIVYCLEGVDAPDGARFDALTLPDEASFEPIHDDALLGGVTVLATQALERDMSRWQGTLYGELRGDSPPVRSVPIRLVPYFAWAERGDHPMKVWLPRQL